MEGPGRTRDAEPARPATAEPRRPCARPAPAPAAAARLGGPAAAVRPPGPPGQARPATRKAAAGCGLQQDPRSLGDPEAGEAGLRKPHLGGPGSSAPFPPLPGKAPPLSRCATRRSAAAHRGAAATDL